MVTQTTSLNKRTNPTILALVVVLGFMLGYLYYQGIAGESSVSDVLPVIDPKFLSFKDMQFNLSVLDGASFRELKTYGEYPVQPGVTGRSDPFAPY